MQREIMLTSSQIKNWILPISILVLFCSCGWEDAVKRIDDQQNILSHNQVLLQSQINDLRSEHEKTLIEQSCKNPRVLKFLQDCKKFLETGEGHECSKLNVEQALKFMREEQHVVVRLRPVQGLPSMTENRRNQLAQLLGPSKLKTISSILIVAQPASDDPESGNQALVLGRKLRGYLHETLHVSENIMFRPLLISCRGKSQMLDLYGNQVVDDKPDFEEPQGKSPKVALWIFRLDCGNVATTDLDNSKRQPGAGPGAAYATN